ncbi:MAG TPA: NAD(P)-dependent oxidoreductase [Mycobacteriales bacterium]|nr:NAD(P)-dependent oxidoreductase [Mycobacteriales bacterium]
MRVVVAGAGGVAGRALVPLLARHHQVVGLDRPEVAPADGVQWLVADIRDWRGLQNALAAVHPVDAVVNLVMAPNAGLGDKDQARMHFDANVTGSWTLLNEALAGGVRRFVYVSTLNVYGDLTVGVHDESDDLLVNQTRDVVEPYGLTKLLAERVLEYICATRDATGVALRLDGLHVPGVMERAGTHIEDLADAIHAALTQPLTGFATCNLTARPAHRNTPTDRAKELLGWTAQHTFDTEPEAGKWTTPLTPPLGSVPLPDL